MKIGRKTRVALSVLATAMVVALLANLSLGDKRVDQKVEDIAPAADTQFQRTVVALLGPPLVPGNEVRALVNGDEIFPAMLGAIREARHTVNLETYIYWSGAVGKQFTDALIERARAGVRVNVLFDAVGSERIDESFVEAMKGAGVRVERYNPLRWHSVATYNNRTHRKLLVVDGKVGFTGGVGIADEWSGNAQSPRHWRDTHFRVEGPAVAQMQGAFMENWTQVTGEVLHGARYFPEVTPRGTQRAQVVISFPGGGHNMQLLYLLSIAAARRSIDLSAAYFVPDDVEVRTLVAALERGARVRIIVPGPHMDVDVVRRASRASWGALLRAGAEIYEYQPTMFHCKVMVVDDIWTSVGSTNFDTRSFAVNDEANLNVHDAAFAGAQRRIFEADLQRSRRVTLAEWENRPLAEKLWEHTVGLVSSQL